MVRTIAVTLLLSLSLFVTLVASHDAVEHIVGDSFGWSLDADLSAWVSDNNFTVGDTIFFHYKAPYGLERVSAKDYDTCNTSKPIESYSGGGTSIYLDKEGPMFFICPTSDYCTRGVKLAIDVAPDRDIPTISSPFQEPSNGTTTIPSHPPPISKGTGIRSPPLVGFVIAFGSMLVPVTIGC